MHPQVPPLAQAAGQYAVSIRSKRDLLQTLFYATRNSAAEAWTLYQRLIEVETIRIDGSVVALDWNLREELRGATTAAEATAEDSARAFMLIVDYSRRMFESAAGGICTRSLGPYITTDVTLNSAVWALANQARHLHSWTLRDPAVLEQRPEIEVIRKLGHDPLNPRAAREVLCVGLRDVPSYVRLEEMLIETAHDALKGTGRRLALVTAGTMRLDVVRDDDDTQSGAKR